LRRPAKSEEISRGFLDACLAELDALKPGNVHRLAAGHNMTVDDFVASAEAAAPIMGETGLAVGERIRRAVEATRKVVGQNTNLGIVLLAAPLAKAASETAIEMGLRRRLGQILSELDERDAEDAFAAIRLANPAGLGNVDEGDVRVNPKRMTLIAAMHLAAERDRIANAYVTTYSDVFDFALPAL